MSTARHEEVANHAITVSLYYPVLHIYKKLLMFVAQMKK